MTASQPSPTNLSDELDSIMLKYMHGSGWNGHIEADVYQDAKREIMSAITAAYAEAMNEIIGDDETGPGHYPMVTKAYMKRNLLRAEQRQRLQRLLPTNGSSAEKPTYNVAGNSEMLGEV